MVGAVRRVFGPENFRALFSIQALLDTFTIAFIFYIGRRVYNVLTGILSALGYGLFSMTLLYTAQLQTETLALHLMSASIASFLWFMRKRSWQRAVLTGALVGLAVQVRLNLLPLILIFLGYAAYAPLRKWCASRRSLMVPARDLALMAGACVCVIAPISIRNSLILGEPVIVCGSTAERLLLGNSPISRGEYAGAQQPIPKEWEMRLKDLPPKEKEKLAKQLAREFMFETHPAYYWFTVVPNKFKKLLFEKHWVYVGQHSGNSMEFPFGPKWRFVLFSSLAVTFFGLCGLLLPGRYPWFLAACWSVLFITIQALIIEARYRLPAEVMLLITSAAVVQRAFFGKQAAMRLTVLATGIMVVSVGWTVLAFARFTGPNLLTVSRLADPAGLLSPAIQSTLTVRRTLQESKQPAELSLGRFKIDAGHCSHLAVAFNYRLLRPEGREHDYNVSTDAWPRIILFGASYDDTGTTLSHSMPLQNAPDLSTYQTNGGR